MKKYIFILISIVAIVAQAQAQATKHWNQYEYGDDTISIRPNHVRPTHVKPSKYISPKYCSDQEFSEVAKMAMDSLNKSHSICKSLILNPHKSISENFNTIKEAMASHYEKDSHFDLFVAYGLYFNKKGEYMVKQLNVIGISRENEYNIISAYDLSSVLIELYSYSLEPQPEQYYKRFITYKKSIAPSDIDPAVSVEQPVVGSIIYRLKLSTKKYRRLEKIVEAETGKSDQFSSKSKRFYVKILNVPDKEDEPQELNYTQPFAEKRYNLTLDKRKDIKTNYEILKSFISNLNKTDTVYHICVDGHYVNKKKVFHDKSIGYIGFFVNKNGEFCEWRFGHYSEAVTNKHYIEDAILETLTNLYSHSLDEPFKNESEYGSIGLNPIYKDVPTGRSFKDNKGNITREYDYKKVYKNTFYYLHLDSTEMKNIFERVKAETGLNGNYKDIYF